MNSRLVTLRLGEEVLDGTADGEDETDRQAEESLETQQP